MVRREALQSRQCRQLSCPRHRRRWAEQGFALDSMASGVRLGALTITATAGRGALPSRRGTGVKEAGVKNSGGHDPDLQAAAGPWLSAQGSLELAEPRASVYRRALPNWTSRWQQRAVRCPHQAEDAWRLRGPGSGDLQWGHMNVQTPRAWDEVSRLQDHGQSTKTSRVSVDPQ